MCVQSGPSSLDGVFLREIQRRWKWPVFSLDGQFLVVSDPPTNTIQVLRACDESFVRSFGQGSLKDPRRLAISPDGTTVLVSDCGLQAVLQYRMDGALVRQIGSHGQAAGKFIEPRGLVVSKAGELFVTDSHNHRVQVFRVSDGTFLRQIGGAKGSGKGQFNMPMDMALSPDEAELLVADYNNHRIQVFRARDGQHLREWGSSGSAHGQFSGPMSVEVTGSGEVVVADMCNKRVSVFDLDGTFRRSINSQSSGLGQFVFKEPCWIAWSPTSRELCVCQLNDPKLQFNFFVDHDVHVYICVNSNMFNTKNQTQIRTIEMHAAHKKTGQLEHEKNAVPDSNIARYSDAAVNRSNTTV